VLRIIFTFEKVVFQILFMTCFIFSAEEFLYESGRIFLFVLTYLLNHICEPSSILYETTGIWVGLQKYIFTFAEI